jgi:universal stress protein A|tara:strand:- start:7648 stop:8100 length:453 start_codon:yes stop_codon:yes gene_type:complete
LFVACLNILVALDTSEEAGEVLDAATRLVRGKDVQITIVNVIKPLIGFYKDMLPMMGDRDTTKSQAINQASISLKTLADDKGIEPKSIDIILGSPAAEIRRKAEEINADVIVMVTQGNYGLGRLLGSNANGVLYGATRDLLAMKIQVESL